MARTKNGITAAITLPRGERTATDAITTKAMTVAFAHPTPREESLDWACAGHPDPEAFHPTDEETLAEVQDICSACPARSTCLDLGLARKEWGVWGGVLLEGGKRLDVPRAPGRPRKTARLDPRAHAA